MELPKLLSRKTVNILGLNAGTSADGLDMALVRMTRRDSRRDYRFLTGAERRYPADLRAAVLNFARAGKSTFDDLIFLDNQLGRFYGRSAASYVRQLRTKGYRVDAIASHGQTVHHASRWIVRGRQRQRGSLQLGSLEAIAAGTGRVVAGDFRQADIALGNEGAPITVAAMHRLFADQRKARLILNLGGIANYFYFSAADGRAVSAGDCGPGNSLSDLLAQALFGTPYDRDGRLARRGTVSDKLLSRLLAEPFFASRRISTGREEFGPELAERMLAFARRYRLPKADILATAVELTARTVVKRIGPVLSRDRGLREIYLTGGGLRNKLLRGRLRELLPGVDFLAIDSLGIPSGLVEAAAFAVMAGETLSSVAAPTVFAAGKEQSLRPILGRIVQPPVKGKQ
jgi:anhydro-N-acetylmuramic acid kinase